MDGKRILIKGGTVVTLEGKHGDGRKADVLVVGRHIVAIEDTLQADGAQVIDATDMHDAVRRATELCASGDAVVLSPACASYDMFQNFGHRGRVFREAVSAVGAQRLDVSR